MRYKLIPLVLWVVVIGAIVAIKVFGQTTNWNGLNDTSQVHLFRSDSLRYSKIFPLTMFENMAIVAKFDDTSATGYANDSVSFTYGYQVGYPVYDTGGTKDTAWTYMVTLDTVASANLGTVNIGFVDSTGTTAISQKDIDTLNVSGYATSIAQFSPPWGVFIRYWAQGQTGNKKGSYIGLTFDQKRRLYYNVSKGD